MLVSWVGFPLLLLGMWGGVGLAVEALLARRLPTALLPGLGFATVVVAGGFLTLTGSTASLTAPVVCILAAAGFATAVARRRPLRPPVPLMAALAFAFVCYAAPIVLSGEATIAGFIRLDDTATWLAFTDHVLANGRDVEGLAPSTYEATLSVNIGDGYPIGAFVPFAVAVEVAGTDPAWLIQPYMATLGVLLVLALWALGSALSASAWIRATIAAVAAQASLLYGYYLWGGVKEIAAAALIAGGAAFAADAVRAPADWRRLAGVALSSGALIGVLSVGGAVWIAPLLAVLLVALTARLGRRATARRAAGLTAALGALALPAILPGGLLPPTSSPLSDDEARGNLAGPLDPLQAAGVWPAGDFRFAPESEAVAYLLAALAIGLGAVALAWAWQRRAVGLLGLFAAALAGGVALLLAGSPWVDGKALATASPFVLFAALLGACVLADGSRRGMIGFGGVLLAGVLWSSALAYRDVSLAPRDQLAELEAIGEMIAGEGPALMTEYSPYGARHFLRGAEAEAVSELRRRRIRTLAGDQVPKGESADTDELDPASLAPYRTLVLRRSPVRSRPPGAYEQVWEGVFYEVWQRREDSVAAIERLPLGSGQDPLAVPRCSAVRRLATRGPLAAATGVSPLVVRDGELRVPRGGEFEAWLKGSVHSRAELVVDGEPVSSVRHQLNNEGGFVSFGTVVLAAGEHELAVRSAGADLHPGSGGGVASEGPLLLTRAPAPGARIIRATRADAAQLCGREWDWIEAG